uniref:heat shock cognate 70 kDa protein-like n=1 Tax=Erigeron canadensis TaxID=72917 RepID=UPI001CB9735E|nr:heat shock cognate 70 kDa protein-like [Erigeron canadensis]
MAGEGIGPAIGIDLGTTYSCVGVWQHNQVEIIPNDQGNRTMPSCVSFTDGGILTGEAAKNQVAVNPTYTVFDAKRLIGRRFNDANVQQDMKLWPFRVIKGANDIPKILVSYKGEEKEFAAEEISSMVLRKLKETAEQYLGKIVKDAVITVPAYFDDSQRQATKDAGHVAGLNVLQIINEPTSAAIAYGLDMKSDLNRETNVLIFDLGGGTFDVSIVAIDQKGKLQVKAVGGDTHLGGQDFDNVMLDHFVTQFNKKHKTDASGNLKALGRLRVACEKAKRVLSSSTETTIEIDGLHQGIDFNMRISRAKFENLNSDFFTKCIATVESCLNDAKLSKKYIDEVVLVGGSTRIPKVQQLLQEFFDGKELSKRIHADEAVAYGASVLAAKLSGEKSQKVKDLVLLDIVPLSLGVNVRGGLLSVVIPRNTPIPAKKNKNFISIEDNQKTMDFNVYQGERAIAKDNNWLGYFEVPVPPAPKGKAKVNVVFEIDGNGILKCTGEDISTGLKKKIRINSDKQRLSKEEIDKMLKDAKKYKLEDEEYKKAAFARNALEEYIDNIKIKIKTIGKTNKAKLHKEDMKKMENAIADASDSLDGNELEDVGTYEKTLNQLEKLCFPIIAKLV